MTTHATFATRAGLEGWARGICDDEGVPVPPIKWADSPHAYCHKRRICMPSPEYLDEQDPEHEWYRLPALLLHELAHWVAFQREGRIRHSPWMYATLFRLSDRWRLPTRVLRRWEREYKPRASVAGWRLYREGGHLSDVSGQPVPRSVSVGHGGRAPLGAPVSGRPVQALDDGC